MTGHLGEPGIVTVVYTARDVGHGVTGILPIVGRRVLTLRPGTGLTGGTRADSSSSSVTTRQEETLILLGCVDEVDKEVVLSHTEMCLVNETLEI